MFKSDFFEKIVENLTGAFHRNSGKIIPRENNNRGAKETETMEEISAENGFILSVDAGSLKKDFYVPEEILALILSFVDFDDMIFSCRLVCHSWKNIVEDFAARQKGEREYGKQLEKSVLKADKKKKIFPWYIYYIACHKNLFGRNLLKNNCGQNKFKHWQILSNGGDNWKVEKTPQGSEPLPADDDFEGCTSCFVTSFHSNSKSQVIDLSKEGFVPKIMDEIQPVIKISEWFAGRFDCGCVYELKVALLDKSKQPIADFEQRESIRQWEGNQWKKVEHEFSCYGAGVRYIAFLHSGVDSQFWAGHYGSKMSGAVVKLYYDPQRTKNAECQD